MAFSNIYYVQIQSVRQSRQYLLATAYKNATGFPAAFATVYLPPRYISRSFSE